MCWSFSFKEASYNQKSFLVPKVSESEVKKGESAKTIAFSGFGFGSEKVFLLRSDKGGETVWCGRQED